MQAKNNRLITLKVQLPLLPGSVSSAASTCGKPHCACKADPPKLHGIYYRWTGFSSGKRTTITLSKAEAHECQRRIGNYRKLRKQIEKIVAKSLMNAPWKSRA